LLDRLEKKLEQYPDQLMRAAVELAKDWRTDKYLRNLEAMMLVADKTVSLCVTGNGDVLEPEHGTMAIGSGGNYALCRRAGADRQRHGARKEIARRAMEIAADICVYTNGNTIDRNAGCSSNPEIRFVPVTKADFPMLRTLAEEPAYGANGGARPRPNSSYIRDMVEGRDPTRPFVFHGRRRTGRLYSGVDRLRSSGRALVDQGAVAGAGPGRQHWRRHEYRGWGKSVAGSGFDCPESIHRKAPCRRPWYDRHRSGHFQQTGSSRLREGRVPAIACFT
jgi:hypothetical protein